MKRHHIRIALAALALLSTPLTAAAQVLPEFRLKLTAGTCDLSLETAQNPRELQRGLMFRKDMAPDAGMIFVMDTRRQPAFWMKNTLIPLDIAFVSPDWKVMAIEQMQPMDLTVTTGPVGTRYAIELNVNRFAECDVAPGDMLKPQL